MLLHVTQSVSISHGCPINYNLYLLRDKLVLKARREFTSLVGKDFQVVAKISSSILDFPTIQLLLNFGNK